MLLSIMPYISKCVQLNFNFEYKQTNFWEGNPVIRVLIKILNSLHKTGFSLIYCNTNKDIEKILLIWMLHFRI